MPIRFVCPRCQREHQGISTEWAGRQIRCECGQPVQLGPPADTPPPRRDAATAPRRDVSSDRGIPRDVVASPPAEPVRPRPPAIAKASADRDVADGQKWNPVTPTSGRLRAASESETGIAAAETRTAFVASQSWEGALHSRGGSGEWSTAATGIWGLGIAGAVQGIATGLAAIFVVLRLLSAVPALTSDSPDYAAVMVNQILLALAVLASGALTAFSLLALTRIVAESEDSRREIARALDILRWTGGFYLAAVVLTGVVLGIAAPEQLTSSLPELNASLLTRWLTAFPLGLALLAIVPLGMLIWGWLAPRIEAVR